MKFLALDIGGSKIMSAIATISQTDDRKTCALDRIAKKTLPRQTDVNHLLAEIRSIIPQGPELEECLAVGVNVPGLTDPANGMWVYAPFSGIRDVPIVQILSEMVGGKPIAIDNDVNACAMAEKLFGVCTKIDDFLWITVSNGIGGGLVLGGNVYSGATGNAGEFGHINAVENGAKCGCGNLGCLEAEAAGPAIARRFRNEIEKQFGADSEEFYNLRESSAAEIAALARNGNKAAMDVFQTTARMIGKAASYAVNLLNLPMIVVGGGVSGAFDLLEPEMKKTLIHYSFHAANANIRIEKTVLGYEAALIGAATSGYLNDMKRRCR